MSWGSSGRQYVSSIVPAWPPQVTHIPAPARDSRKRYGMDHPIDTSQWEVRAAYRQGWEVRLAYYERLLRSVMEMLEAAQSIMKADELTEELRGVTRALIELEDAWGALALKKSASLVRGNEQGPRQPEGGGEGGSDGE